MIAHPLFQWLGVSEGENIGAGAAVSVLAIYILLGLVALAVDRRALLVDLTCDSDGKIDRFVDLRDIKKALEVHALNPGEPYYLGAFLVGAYQETLGDLHNLFGDTDAVHVRLDGEDLQASGGEVRSDFDGGRFAQVVDIRFEGEAEAGDDGVQAGGGADLSDDVMRLGVIDLTGCADEARFGGSGVDDEPRVDGDTVSADAGAGLQDLHARVAIG